MTTPDPPARVVAAARALATGEGHLAILTGAGVSVAAGLATFRGPHGLWEGRDPTELATPEAFARDPEAVWRWYGARLAGCLAAEATRAHHDLAAIAGAVSATLVTQNVDGLHGVAAGGGGAANLVELHGSIRRARCSACPYATALPEPPVGVPQCPTCGGALRPDVVWFGEALAAADIARAEAAFASATLALVVGTSGTVWPAAGLAHLAEASGAVLVLVDPEETHLDDLADWRLSTGADEGVRVVRDALFADAVGA